jgi:transposase
MKERLHFLRDYQLKLFGFGELCAQYGISCKTGHKWVRRFRDEGLPGLADRPRRPKHCPHGMAAAVADKLIALRRQHPRWGARKILAVLEKRQPAQNWPAASTVGDLFKRSGLIVARRHRPQPGHPGGDEHAECGLDGGLQRAVQDGGRGILFSLDGGGWLQPLFAHLSGTDFDRACGRSAGI